MWVLQFNLPFSVYQLPNTLVDEPDQLSGSMNFDKAGHFRSVGGFLNHGEQEHECSSKVLHKG